jgi:hypothetical protein
MVSASMKYALGISPSASTGPTADKAAAGAAGGPRSSVAADWAETTRSRGSATLQRLRALRGCTRSLPLGSAFGSLIRHRAASRCSQQLGFVVRIRRPEARFNPVKPSPTQSNLVKPSQTIIFSGPFSLTPWQTRPSIRLIRAIRGLPNPPSRPSLAASHSPLATAAVKPSPTQSNLVKPSPTINFRVPQRSRGGQRHRIMGESVILRVFGRFRSFDLLAGGC